MNREELKAAAETMIAQLGGKKFVAMTGAKDFLFGETEGNEPYLQFKIPTNFAKDNISIIRIVLNQMDTYDVQYLKMGKQRNDFGGFSPIAEQVAMSEGIYCDMLQDDFKEKTGLDTNL
ncbi:hypothetical protein K6L09_21295 [Burkholderia cepacia]